MVKQLQWLFRICSVGFTAALLFFAQAVQAQEKFLEPSQSSCKNFGAFRPLRVVVPHIPPSNVRYTSTEKSLLVRWDCPPSAKASISYFCCSCADGTGMGMPTNRNQSGFEIEGPPGEYAVQVSCQDISAAVSFADGPYYVARLAGPNAAPVADERVELALPVAVLRQQLSTALRSVVEAEEAYYAAHGSYTECSAADCRNLILALEPAIEIDTKIQIEVRGGVRYYEAIASFSPSQKGTVRVRRDFDNTARRTPAEKEGDKERACLGSEVIRAVISAEEEQLRANGVYRNCGETCPQELGLGEIDPFSVHVAANKDGFFATLHRKRSLLTIFRLQKDLDL